LSEIKQKITNDILLGIPIASRHVLFTSSLMSFSGFRDLSAWLNHLFISLQSKDNVVNCVEDDEANHGSHVRGQLTHGPKITKRESNPLGQLHISRLGFICEIARCTVGLRPTQPANCQKPEISQNLAKRYLHMELMASTTAQLT
jgi:hypothetical protein